MLPAPPDLLNMSNYGPLHPSRIDKGIAASVAATRQKSCNACVRGKRRCDKKAPKCTRCSSKGLECVYARVPPGATADSVLLDDDYFSSAARSTGSGSAKRPSDADADATCATSLDSSSQPSAGSDMHDFTCFNGSGGFVDLPSLAGSSAGNTSPESSNLDCGLDSSDGCGGPGATGAGAGMHDHTRTANTAAAEFMHMDDMNGFSIADLLAANNSPFGGDFWDIHTFPIDSDANNTNNTNDNNLNNIAATLNSGIDPTANGKIDPRPLQVVPARPIRDLSMLREECEVTCFDPLEVHDARSRPGHILKVFSDLHITFSQTRALPFLHSRLYSSTLPKPVMTAFCTASSYANRTTETKGWIVRLIGEAAREIYAEGEKAVTPLDKLARVHALLVVNTMRFLDGDLWLRAAAERELGVLINWATELIEARDKLEEGIPKAQFTDKNFPPKSWESWLLIENIRRTTVATISFVCLIAIIKGETPDCDLWTQALHFTASRHLWAAQSSVDFFRAWREKPRFLIEQLQYREFWQYATPDDLDEFTRIMLTTQTGTEAMDHFMLGDTKNIPVAN